MQRHAVPHVAQEIRGPTCADNFTVRACVGLSSCRDRERKTERIREGEKKRRGVGYTTAVNPGGIRVLDSHPRS